MNQTTVALLFGGCSSEHDVSLESAYAVLTNLDREKFRVIPVGITKEGDWYIFEGSPESIRNGKWEQENPVPVLLNPGRTSGGLLVPRNGSPAIKVDCLLPILHGKNGEDGTVQGIAELAGIPLAGCGSLSSALCMDKARAHRLVDQIFKEAGVIRSPKSAVVNTADDFHAYEFAAVVGYPVFVKPIRAGSSVGITKVKCEAELRPALELALSHDREAAIEECIRGKEISCAVLGRSRKDVITGDLAELELEADFFDYHEKYTHENSRLHIPARLDEETVKEIKSVAVRIYFALDCRDFARVDLFLTPEGELIFNEVNTIPGMTELSLYPAMMASAGMQFKDVLTRIIELAMGE